LQSVLDSVTRRRSFLFFYLFIILASIPLNTFFLYVSWQHIRQRNEIGVYLLNLALSDFAFTLGLSQWLDYLWRGVWARGGSACVVSIYCLYTNFYTSGAFLCCIALNRYLAAAHPLKYAFVRRVGTATAVSLAIWGLVLIFNAGTIRTEDSDRDELSLCLDILRTPTENMVRGSVLRFSFGFVVPLLVLLFSTWGIFKAVWSNQATEEKESKRVAKLLLMVLLCHLLCFGPVHITELVRIMVTDCETVQLLLYPHKVAVAISCLNCLADPLLYCFSTRTGKARLHQVALYFRGTTVCTERDCESMSGPQSNCNNRRNSETSLT
uniref:G protein-coupled receptor 65 n=1 Tax=Neogobius melanostomus TaxID=47308 RepID=A0A8C6WES8_9GOBI